jgi:hypothetical protein
MDKSKVGVLLLLFSSTCLWSQIKVSIIGDTSNPSSAAVIADLRSKITSHPKQFLLVNANNSDLNLLITADCIPREKNSDMFTCFYTSSYAGGTTKNFMGGGIYEAAALDGVEDNFLSSIAQDIGERWNAMVRDNALENLEACLLLTQSSCKVPDPLVPELKVKTINMSQYLQRGKLKK